MLDHLTELVDASGGGALCLFSSRRGAELAAEHVRARLDLTLAVQGEDSMANLVRTFREEEDACLFGTLTLWQGVDVPGRSLRLVTIDRIPFPPTRRPAHRGAPGAHRPAGRQRLHVCLRAARGPAARAGRPGG